VREKESERVRECVWCAREKEREEERERERERERKRKREYVFCV